MFYVVLQKQHRIKDTFLNSNSSKPRAVHNVINSSMTGGFIYMQVTSCYSQSCYLNIRRLNQHSVVCIRLTSPHLICQTEIQKPQLYFFALTIKKDRCIYVITKSKTFILVNGVVIGRVYNYVIVEMYGDLTDFFGPSASWFSKYLKKKILIPYCQVSLY